MEEVEASSDDTFTTTYRAAKRAKRMTSAKAAHEKKGSSSPRSAVASMVTVAYMAAEDIDALQCSVCYFPLKPPIFQCHEGHAVCSACRDKLAPAGKCYMCSVPIISYHRCRAMESLVESIRVPCPNATYGCDARPAYYDEGEHRRVCPHAPLRCPGTGCGFVGSVKALRAHFTGAAHGWPPTTKITAGAFVPVTLLDGFNFILARPAAANKAKAAAGGQYLVLLNVARRPEGEGRGAGVGVTMHFVGVKEPTEKLTCLVEYQRELYGAGGGEGRKKSLGCHRVSTETNLECAEDLSRGLPNPDDRIQFVVPDYLLADEDKEGAIRVTVQISIKVMK